MNGKVSAVSGPYLNQLKHIVTGLPVSDHDHGINGITFGDNNELYIQTPGNTNGGIPGALSSTRLQEENLFSCATIVARNLNNPEFDGRLEYDENGNQVGGADVSVFASGQRNSYGIVLHSNGNLYATDNGPNNGFGDKSTSCTESASIEYQVDKLNLIKEGQYYGHSNRKRGETDPRQCVWHSIDEPSDSEYTAPISKLRSSSNGLCEFETEHFAGQLQGNLIISQWRGTIVHVALSSDGESSKNGPSDFPPGLIYEDALDIVQGPDGTLFTANHRSDQVDFYIPIDTKSSNLRLMSVFPRRGPTKSGNSTLTIFGDHLYTNGFASVMVGDRDCVVLPPTSDAKVTCLLPDGTGMVDIVVTTGLQSSTFQNGYRYITAEPRPPTIPPPTQSQIPTPAPIQTPDPTPSPGVPVPAPTNANVPPPTFVSDIGSLGITDLLWWIAVTEAISDR